MLVPPSPARVGGAATLPLAVWPQTCPGGWCGEWEGRGPIHPPADHPTPHLRDVAAHLFIRRIAPAVEAHDPAAWIGPLLDQLPPDVRKVVVRAHGLDGRPVTGIKETAKELRMSQNRVRALLAVADERLAGAVEHLAAH